MSARRGQSWYADEESVRGPTTPRLEPATQDSRAGFSAGSSRSVHAALITAQTLPSPPSQDSIAGFSAGPRRSVHAALIRAPNLPSSGNYPSS
jgi:hypothetical protein